MRVDRQRRNRQRLVGEGGRRGEQDGGREPHRSSHGGMYTICVERQSDALAAPARGDMADLSAFPINREMAGDPSRPPAALQPADAERGQGLDHAGGDRPALRAASRSISAPTTSGRRNSCRSTPTARSRRSSIPTGPTASRWRCSNRARSCSISRRRPASCCPPSRRARYETLDWLIFQMGGIGPMFGQVGFFHKFAGREYEDKRPLDRYRRGIEAAARRAGEPPRRPRLDDGRRIHRSPTSRRSAGCAISSASMAPAISWNGTSSRTCSAGSISGSRGRRCSAG